MNARLLAILFASTSLVVLGCAADTADGSSDPTDDEVKTTTDDGFLQHALETAGVPNTPPAKGALGVSGAVTAKIFCSSPVVPKPVRHCDALATKGSKSYGALAAKDISRVETILGKRGVDITPPPRGLAGSGQWRIADVSCTTVVAPGSPVHCTVDPSSL